MIKTTITSVILLMVTSSQLLCQVDAAAKRYIRLGSLQSHFTAYGSERAWNNTYYEGLIWPAQYPEQDNAVIKRYWIACEDFDDPSGRNWEHYGVYVTANTEGIGVFPMELKQSTRFMPPSVYVDGNDLKAIFNSDIDTLNTDQIPDRIVTNVVNTSMGLTMTRTVYAFSQQYHDNYFIKFFTYTNTGNTDWDAEIELDAPLNGVRIGWGTRYSLGREAAYVIGDGQSWGKHSWVSRRGEDYALHYTDPITLDAPIVDWLRCGFSWAGQTSKNAYDNVGGPDIGKKGRLTSPHHAGSVVLHVDRNAADATDDISQPTFLGWHAGDTYPNIGDLRPRDAIAMTQLYSMLSGNPHGGDGNGGTNRYWDDIVASITDPYDPWTYHNDGGGTNVMMTYGPFDLAPGESVTIVEAEAVNGIDRQTCEWVGERWKQAYDNPSDNGPFDLPDGGTTGDLNYFKNSWVLTGTDSILLSFSRAKRNFDSGFGIPQPPQPPASFTVESGGDRIFLSWLPSPSESNEADFSGYRIFRAIGKPDTTYSEIFACGAGTDNPELVYHYDDTSPIRGQSYYYYIVAFNDGSNNNTQMNPHGELHSAILLTRTTQAAYLQRPPGETLDAVRVVPNPYNIKNRQLQYIGEPNKLMFLDLPPYCTLRIFTERGDLINTIEHTDGSGDEAWDLVTESNQIVVSGIYLLHVETPEGESTYEKFIVIR